MQTQIPILPIIQSFIFQIPSVICSAVAISFCVNHQTVNSTATKWALWGFALAASLLILAPLSQFFSIWLAISLPTANVAARHNLIHYSVLVQSVLWSILHASIYYCLYKAFREAILRPPA